MGREEAEKSHIFKRTTKGIFPEDVARKVTHHVENINMLKIFHSDRVVLDSVTHRDMRKIKRQWCGKPGYKSKRTF